MDRWRIIIKFIFVGGSPNITLLIKIPSNFTIYSTDHNIVPDIKLPALIKQGPINILLYKKGLGRPIAMRGLGPNNGLNPGQILTINNASAPIGKLPRLEYPTRLALIFGQSIVLSQKLQILFVFQPRRHMEG
jgi:hypothetical protein